MFKYTDEQTSKSILVAEKKPGGNAYEFISLGTTAVEVLILDH